VGFSRIEDIRENVVAAQHGPLPADLQRAIDAIGIVHPLLYQYRTQL